MKIKKEERPAGIADGPFFLLQFFPRGMCR